VLDGDLVTLPGGAVKLAVGAEYSSERWISRLGDSVPGAETTGSPAVIIGGKTILPAIAALPAHDLSRNVKSAFGELVIPIFGKDNATPGLKELTLSVAGRYDSYSDVGDTFNPRFGLTYKPSDWLKLRGSWGKSFNAPSLADAPSADITTVFFVPSAFGFLPAGSLLQSNGGPYPTPPANSYVYAVRGNSPNIKPQKAKTLSLGADFQPGFIPGLTASVTYYKIDLKGVISLPPGNGPQVVYRDFPAQITLNPTTQQLDALVASGQSFPFGLPCHSAAINPCSVYAIVDLRKSNLGDFKLDGLDFNLSYKHDTSFGSVWLNVNANYELNRKFRSSSVLPFVDQLAANNSRFKSRAVLGGEVGNLLGQVAWSHGAGYKLDPAIGFVPQTHVSGFDLFDLYFRYDFKGERLLRDLSISLNINNVFDADPPEYRQFSPGGIQGFTNGGTLGRLFQVGVSKKF
jgi:iron complex outermembrane receptor protein